MGGGWDSEKLHCLLPNIREMRKEEYLCLMEGGEFLLLEEGDFLFLQNPIEAKTRSSRNI